MNIVEFYQEVCNIQSLVFSLVEEATNPEFRDLYNDVSYNQNQTLYDDLALGLEDLKVIIEASYKVKDFEICEEV